MTVCVGRLQYCQYSQKIISLITLLLDLIGTGYIIKQFGRTVQIMTLVCSKKYKPVKMFPVLPAYTFDT